MKNKTKLKSREIVFVLSYYNLGFPLIVSVNCFNTCFFIRNTFISNGRLKLAKNQPNTKQHAEPELLLFENYSHSSSM